MAIKKFKKILINVLSNRYILLKLSTSGRNKIAQRKKTLNEKTTTKKSKGFAYDVLPVKW